MKKITRCITLLAALASVSSLAQEPHEKQASLNFVGADIESVVRAIGHYTGKRLIWCRRSP